MNYTKVYSIGEIVYYVNNNRINKGNITNAEVRESEDVYYILDSNITKHKNYVYENIEECTDNLIDMIKDNTKDKK